MASLHNDVFDNGLSTIDNNTETLHICNADPGLTWGNIATYGIGNKATPTIAAPSDRGAGGREVVISAITDGSVTSTDTASHFALTDDSETKILVSGALGGSVAVSSGNSFTLTEFSVGIPDPA